MSLQAYCSEAWNSSHVAESEEGIFKESHKEYTDNLDIKEIARFSPKKTQIQIVRNILDT